MPSETILLLDPQHTLTPQFEEAAFRPRGHRVLACDSLAEAIGLVKQFPTSLGVVAMPATPEFTQEAIATLRAAQPRLPVLVLLDSDSPELVQAARQAKANDLLVNPRPAEVDAALAAGKTDAEEVEAIFRLTALPTYEERFVVPPLAREVAVEAWEKPLTRKQEAGFSVRNKIAKRKF